MGEGSSTSSKQCAKFEQDSEGKFILVKVKNLTVKAALTAHIISETTRDEYTLTFADNGI